MPYQRYYFSNIIAAPEESRTCI